MSTKIKMGFLASCIFFAGVSAGLSQQNAQYIFRNKPTVIFKNISDPVIDDEQVKDINATFAAGVGVLFSQKLPMKTEWQDDAWVITSGTLPAGITFNSESLVFSGTPTVAGESKSISMSGLDVYGREVASASVTFNVYDIVGELFTPDIYAHTGKYKFFQLPLPSGSSARTWEATSDLPAGMSLIGRNIDGTPTEEGVSSFHLEGKNNHGDTVATYIGNFTVQDGPVFPKIEESVFPLPKTGYIHITSLRPTPIERAIGGDLSKVKYFVEVEDDASMPGNLSSNNQPLSLNITGSISQPYDTARLRWKAIDTDSTIGYSNWFTYGTSDLTLSCTGSPTVTWVAGTPVNSFAGVPQGAVGTLTYSLKSGILPDNVSLGSDGYFTGTPTSITPLTPIVVEVDVSGVKQECNFNVKVDNAYFALNPKIEDEFQHVRVGSYVAGSVNVIGGIPTYELDFDTPNTDFSFTSPTIDTETVSFTGTINETGLPVELGFTASNGDGGTQESFAPIYSYGPLAFSDVPSTVTIKRLSGAQEWAKIGYDATTAIPDITGVTTQPEMMLDNPANLPAGIEFNTEQNPYAIFGTTNVDVDTYGPFIVTLSDASGDQIQSGPVTIEVIERDPIEIALTTPPVFKAMSGTEGVARNTTVIQPEGAIEFKLTYELNGPSLPNGVSFDPDTGEFKDAGNVDPSDIGIYGPYTITVTDSEFSSAETDEFNLEITDWPMPAATDVVAIRSNVSGNVVDGESQTYVTSGDLTRFINPDTVYGGVNNVTFEDYSPENPANLNYSDWFITGEPTSEFFGNVIVSFSDTQNRVGEIIVPMEIKPYPTIVMAHSNYDVPRLSDASQATIVPAQGVGFWSEREVVFSVDDPSTLPQGMSVNPSTGAILGKSTAAEGTVFNNIVLKSETTTPLGGEMVSYTEPFSITITEQVPLTLNYVAEGDEITYKLAFNQQANPQYTFVSVGNYSNDITGSYVGDLNYSIIDYDGLVGVSIDSNNGELKGYPSTLGSWMITVQVDDDENAVANTEVAIKATLAGGIEVTNAETTDYILRVGEPFNFPVSGDALAYTNNVGAVAFSTVPTLLPVGLSGKFDPIDGTILNGEINQPSESNPFKIEIVATDVDGRELTEKLFANFTVIEELDLAQTETVFNANQFEEAFNISFDSATNDIGNVTYSLSGALPGTRVDAIYTNGIFQHYSYNDGGLVTTTDLSSLPVDAMIFDPVALTLTGFPSQAGTFSLTLSASDDHADGYLYDPGTQVGSNTASASIVLNVDPALSLQVANSANSQTLDLYADAASISISLTNAAYGEPVIWQKIAGTLPTGISSSFGPAGITFSGYPTVTGTFSDIRYRAKDAAGRTIDTEAISFTVNAQQPLELTVPSDPIAMVVNEPGQSAEVTVSKVAFGATLDEEDWEVSNVANLPEGIDFEVVNGNLVFSGTPTVTGNYTNFTVTAIDSKGATASLVLNFRILAPGDAIIATADNVVTKVGKTFSVVPSVSNTYGQPGFASDEISGAYAGQLTLSSSGEISGAFSSTGLKIVNLRVTDETTRLTSVPVEIEVIPNLEVFVASEIAVTQASTMNVGIDTFNDIGTVVYEKSGGVWPDGVDVNSSTGAIISSNVVAAIGTYSGLTIKATDTFGVNTDVQTSNTFSIVVDPVQDDPVINNFVGKQIFVVGSPMSLTPDVRDSVKNNPWTYGNVTYSLSTDVSQYGLTFDTATGTISGTPTEAFILRDVVFTVTHDTFGSTDSTSATWIGAHPADPIVASSGQTFEYRSRVGDTFVTDAPLFDNAMGNLTYKRRSTSVPGYSFDANSGTFSATLGEGYITGTTTPLEFIVEVTDEFGRKGTLDIDQFIIDVLKIEAVGAAGEVNALITSPVPVVKNSVGTLSYGFANLTGPTSSWTGSPDGSISGKFTTGTGATLHTVTITVTDNYDGRTATTNANLEIRSGARYWQFVCKSYDTSFNVAEMNFINANGIDVTHLYTPSSYSHFSFYVVDNLKDGLTYQNWYSPADLEPHSMWINFDFGDNPQSISAVKITKRQPWWGHNCLSWDINSSNDGVNYLTEWSDSFNGWPLNKNDTTGAMEYTSNRPN